jgi:hypothetical protein
MLYVTKGNAKPTFLKLFVFCSARHILHGVASCCNPVKRTSFASVFKHGIRHLALPSGMKDLFISDFLN